jgi:hypothetical protein
MDPLTSFIRLPTSLFKNTLNYQLLSSFLLSHSISINLES